LRAPGTNHSGQPLREASQGRSLPCTSSLGHQHGAEAVNAECTGSLQISVSVTTAPDETQSYKIPLSICERLPALPATCRQPLCQADPHRPPRDTAGSTQHPRNTAEGSRGSTSTLGGSLGLPDPAFGLVKGACED